MSGLTPERRAEIESRAAKVFEIFGDDWHLIYDKDEIEVECRADYTGTRPFPGAYTPIFLTTQWPDHDPTSPLAEFLAASIVDIPTLLGEVDRLHEVGRAQLAMCMAAELERDARLTAGDVERFLKRERDEYEPRGECWNTVDDVLDAFRLHMVTGTPLTSPRPAEGPEAPFVGEEPKTEAEELREKVEQLRAERNNAVATVAEQWKRSVTREREHNADRAAMERFRAERDQLRAVLEDLTVSVEHDRDSSACRERPAYQERLKPCQQREADHGEDCPACTLHAALAQTQKGGAQ
ncbi:hypothetical protein [Streptosporangium sp. CA-115845]|uniref:hypothetical protein n=1 Tax=Streptosporangium sp. CA-115845 TaxID=3240071 RepID=UPI003D8B71B5